MAGPWGQTRQMLCHLPPPGQPLLAVLRSGAAFVSGIAEGAAWILPEPLPVRPFSCALSGVCGTPSGAWNGLMRSGNARRQVVCQQRRFPSKTSSVGYSNLRYLCCLGAYAPEGCRGVCWWCTQESLMLLMDRSVRSP